MIHTQSEYREQLQALMPRGDAWPLSIDAVMNMLLETLAAEFARIEERAHNLFEETDPRTTHELLPDWERVAGLPDPIIGAGVSLEQRRSILVERLTSTGGATAQYLIDVAARLGFTITITEFTPFTVSSGVGDPMYGWEWVFAFQVNAPATSVSYFTVVSGVSDPLAWWGNALLEAVIKRLKPAHTHALFAYA